MLSRLASVIRAAVIGVVIVAVCFGVLIATDRDQGLQEVLRTLGLDPVEDVPTTMPDLPEIDLPDLDPSAPTITLGDASIPVAEPLDLASLGIKYDRSGMFGNDWAYDFDGNGCKTRDDILARDLTDVARDKCQVNSGVLNDPYTGKTIDFRRGPATSGKVQIDHIIPLGWATKQGALDWTQEEREAFANDPINLRAMDGPQNGSKSDQGPGSWMPPNAAFHCDYAQSWVTVASTYGLSMNAADAAKIESVLASC